MRALPVSRLLAVPAVALALLGVAACGATGPSGSTGARSAATPATSAPADEPAMVYVRLTDQPDSHREIALSLGRQVMLMVVNHGTLAHTLRAALPMSGFQVYDPYAATQQPVLASSRGFDIGIPPAHEIDVIFTPLQSGSFALGGDVTPGDSLTVR